MAKSKNPYKPELKFDKSKAWDHLTKQVEFGPRFPGSSGHRNTAQYLIKELEKTCDKVYTQDFQHRWSMNNKVVRMRNIIGEYNWGKAPVNVLLLAHWDTRPTADMEPNSSRSRQPILGANDGASGVAVLLELMRVLKENKTPVGIMILLTDGEDLGPDLDEMFLGATHFSHNLPTPRPDYGILLDMVGDKDLRIPVELNSKVASGEVVDAFYAHAKAIGMAETFPKTDGEYISDDHIPIIQAGIPTIDLIDFTYEPWHTLEDTVDKCSPESLEKVGRTLESWLLKPKPWKPTKPVDEKFLRSK